MKNKIIVLLVTSLINFTLASAITEEERKYLESFGWVLSQQGGLQQYGFTSKEIDAMLVGYRSGILGKDPSYDLKAIESGAKVWLQKKAEGNKAAYMKQVDALRARQQKENVNQAVSNKENGKNAIATLVAANQNIKSTPSGLHYEIVDPGGDTKPGSRDKVTVHYKGTLVDGTEFDSSYKRGPATFGLNRVIRGWTEGLQLIGEGGKIKLYIPPNLAYGDAAKSSIPAGSTLIFDIELINIIKAAPKKKIVAVTPPVTASPPKKVKSEDGEDTEDESK